MGVRGGIQSRSYQLNRELVWNSIVEALQSMGIKTEEINEPLGKITASTGLNFWSIGSRFSIQIVGSEGTTATVVSIQAKPKASITMVDYGHGSREIRKIFTQIEIFIAQKKSCTPLDQTVVGRPVAVRDIAGSVGLEVCPSCSEPVQTGKKFCSKCGNAIQSSGRYCTECGEQLKEGSKFCAGCGAKQ